MKKSQSLKNILLVGAAVLTLGFMSAFTIDTSINNALQIIKRIIITTSGTVTGSVVADLNTGNNNLYINPSYLAITGAYSGQYILTLNNSGYLYFTSWQGST